MTSPLSPAEAGKAAAAMVSVAEVQPNSIVGLGTGSTAAWMVRALAARRAEEQLLLTCVPTSDRTAKLARSLGLKVVSLDEVDHIDLTIDGADEFDPEFRLIKGGGGAHLREKLVAAISERMIVITDPSKDVDCLGAFPLPIEVIPYGAAQTEARIQAVLAEADVETRDTAIRMKDGVAVRTDEGNLIIDAKLSRIGDPEALASALSELPGVVEHGFFLELCDTVIIGHQDGRAEMRMIGRDSIWREIDMAAASALPEPA
ncbi:MAG: ribose-5-phosphate isomerase RpiA [Mangrovicoccus sp.]